MEWGKILVDGRYWEQAEKEVPPLHAGQASAKSPRYTRDRQVPSSKPSKLNRIVKIHKDYTSKQALADILKQYLISECIVDSRITSYASVLALQEQGLKIVSSPDIFQSIREMKNEYEIKKIRRAQKIALEAFDVVRHEIKVGVSESYIAARLEFIMKQGGAEKTSFETIVASGVNSALPHARSTDKRIEDADSVIVDFGAVYQGYCSDFTRTILMPKASTQLHEIYTVVAAAQQKALNVAKLGVRTKEVDLAARTYIETKGYGTYFTHATGHGVGMAVHELPHVSWNSETVLRKGHVITVEPGIYISGVGGVRLEEMVII
jgi:Xaa-Pro aminopeptidase